MYLLHILKDQVELSSPAEGLFQLNNVLLLEGAEHLKLPQRRFFDLLIFCTGGRQRDESGSRRALQAMMVKEMLMEEIV